MKPVATKRLLWNAPAAVAFAAIALAISLAILLFQFRLRMGQYDPEAVPVFYRLFLFEDYPAAFLFMAAVALAAVPGYQQAAAGLARIIGNHPLAVSLIATVALAAGSWWIYYAHPLSPDEAAPYMQSKALAHGALLGQYPPPLLDWLVPRSMQNGFIAVSHATGQTASAQWPGFALLLTPFMAAGVPWLCNPVLGGASVWVIHQLTLRLTSSLEAAGAAVLFTLGSAAFVINSISFYSMTAHLLCNALFALLLLSRTPRGAFLAGLTGGLAVTLDNFVPHSLFAIPWLLWLLTQRNRWSLILSVSVGYLPWIAFVGFGWSHVLHGLASSPVSTQAAFHLPGAQIFRDRTIAVAKMWLWAAPLVVLLAGVGFWRHRENTFFRLLLISTALTLLGCLFMPLDQGHGWGFRYFHSVWFVVPLFAAAALAPASETTGALASSSLGFARWAQAGAIGGLLIVTPYFAWQVHTFIGKQLARVPTTKVGTAKVIFINPTLGYYAEDLIQNDPLLREAPIRMLTHGRKQDAEVMARYFPSLMLLAQDYRGSVWGTRLTAPATPP